MCKLFGNSLVVEFGPKRLKAVQQRMIEDGLCRNSINSRIRRIRHVFKWCISEQIVPTAIPVGLQSVAGLEADRSFAKETDPVCPVSELDILAIKPHVSRPVWGIIRSGLTICTPIVILGMLGNIELISHGPLPLNHRVSEAAGFRRIDGDQ